MATQSVKRLFRKTPVLEGKTVCGKDIWYKMDNLQYSGSFKDRGISHMIQTLQGKAPVTKLICSSGGNAGHAVAVAGNSLNLPVEVFVPVTTLPMMVEKLRLANANVHVGGNNWNEADSFARAALAGDSGAQYIPPFDHPLIWEGHATIIDELYEQLDSAPDVIILSVGGGGLLRGVQLGLQKVGWLDTHIVAVETEGAASFAAAKQAGKVVRLEKIDTIASTLGALAVTESVLDPTINTVSAVVSDRDAVQACLQFADQVRQLVEPSCGAALCITSNVQLASQHLKDDWKNVVVIVCGGSAVSIDLLNGWKHKFGL